MDIESIKAGLGAFKPIERIAKSEKQAALPQGGKSFHEVLTSSLNEVNEMQINANQQIEDLMLGKNGVTTHDAMIAMEKADTAFMLMNQIRGKIVQAYQEVLRTQV